MTQDRRVALYEALDAAQDYLARRAVISDAAAFDLETARVEALAKLRGRQRPQVPTSQLDAFTYTGRDGAIEDAADIGVTAASLIDGLLADPAAFGVEVVGALDEEILLEDLTGV